MTIYTPSQPEKKPDKDSLGPEVVTEPLTSFKDEEEADDVEIATKAMRVNYFQGSRRSFCIHFLLTVMVLVILACGAIGAFVFYRHLNKRAKVYSGVCGNIYFDATYHNKNDKGDARFVPVVSAYGETAPQNDPNADPMYDPHMSSYGEAQMDFFEEGIEVSEVDLYEQLYTPKFDEVRESNVWHDFSRNYTAIADHPWQRCYVMKLNRTAIAPPRDVIDLVDKLLSGYYMPKAKVIRENYKMVYPPIADLKPLGQRILAKCQFYDTYWLEKYGSQVVKRSVDHEMVSETTVTYALLSNFRDHQEIYKLIIHDVKETEPFSDLK